MTVRTTKNSINAEVLACVMMCQAGVANRAPVWTAAHRMKLHDAAPDTTAVATVSDALSPRCRPLACEPMTPIQNAIFQGLVSASVIPSKKPPRVESKRRAGTAASVSPGRRLARHACHAPFPNVHARNNSNPTLTTPSTGRTPCTSINTPAPSDTATAHRKSPEHAPNPSDHAGQKPRSRPRRTISALIGPGGQATDQPSTKPWIKSESTGFCRKHYDGDGRTATPLSL